jgi:hypothetical protein
MGSNGISWHKEFRGAGMPVTAPLFCKPCLANGHQCPAREGEWEPGEPPVCIFCEDGAPCPVMRRSQTPQYRVNAATVKEDAQRSNQIVRGRLQPAVERQPLPARLPRQPPTDVNKPQTVDTKEKEMGTNAKTVPCKFTDCPTQVTERNRSGYCAIHFYVGKLKGGTPKTKRAAAIPKLQRMAAKVAVAFTGKDYLAVGNHNGSAERTAATLLVSERQLDHMFIAWPLEDKVSCVQLWLDRMEG